MSNDNKPPGCFKYGCVGCLSGCAVVVALIFLVSAVHLIVEQEDPRPEQREMAQELPQPPEPPGSPEGAYPLGDSPEVPTTLSVPQSPNPPDSAIGRVVLDVSMGEFIVRPGPANEPIRVEADYDTSAFELSEKFEESDDAGWTYKVSFGSRGGFLGLIMRGGHNGNNRIEITIPQGHPVDIVGKVGIGESEIDLGGLWVREFNVKYGAGDHFVEIREPLPVPMESFRLDASVGEVEVRNLGDGSPRLVEVDQGVGELFLDLNGNWRQDADIDVDFGIGESRLWLPDNVHIDIERARVALGEKRVDQRDTSDLPADAPTLTVSMTGSIGEVRVER